MGYANLHGYSDVEPFEVVKRVSEKTIEIRRMSAVLNPEWKPVALPGGFFAHTLNSNDQKWIITSDTSNPIVRARLRKDGQWHSPYGRHVIAAAPVRFYDYNF